MPKEIARLPSCPLTDQEIAEFCAIVDRQEIAERTARHGFPQTAQRMREVLIKQMSAAKTCKCCGTEHKSIPTDARHSDDDCYGGYYWECSCGSTLFVPELRVGEAA